MGKDIYKELGVDANKTLVRENFNSSVDTKYPYAFVNIDFDLWNPKTWVMTKHPDGSGSRSLLHWLYYLESKMRGLCDLSKLKNDIKDAFTMNAGDIAAAGFIDKYVVTDIIDINQKNVDKNLILQELVKGINEVIALYENYGIGQENKFKIRFLGGETADLVNQCRSYSLNMDFFSRMRKENVVAGEVRPGGVVYGFSSGGRAEWEESKNSGHMSNGSIMTGSTLLTPIYNKSYEKYLDDPYYFKGRFRFEDTPVGLGMSIADAILSPTRQWAIVIKMLIDELKRGNNFDLLHAIVINTGGGQTKIAHVGSGIRYIKSPPEPLPLFKLIQSESGENWKNMFRTYNCGVGLEIIGSPRYNILPNTIQKIADKIGIKCFKLGDCKKAKSKKNEVVLKTGYGRFKY